MVRPCAPCARADVAPRRVLRFGQAEDSEAVRRTVHALERDCRKRLSGGRLLGRLRVMVRAPVPRTQFDSGADYRCSYRLAGDTKLVTDGVEAQAHLVELGCLLTLL